MDRFSKILNVVPFFDGASKEKNHGSSGGKLLPGRRGESPSMTQTRNVSPASLQKPSLTSTWHLIPRLNHPS